MGNLKNFRMKYVGVLIICSVIIVGLSFYYNSKLKIKENKLLIYEGLKEDLRNDFQNIKSKSDFYFNNSLINNGLKLDDSVDLTNQKGNLTNVRKIISNGELRVIYRISEDVCNICYDKTIQRLIHFSDEVGVDNVAIFVPFERMRELRSYLNELDSNIPYFGIRKRELNIEVDSFSPFFFILNKEGKVNHIFVPPKVDQYNRVENYLSILKNRYFFD